MYVEKKLKTNAEKVAFAKAFEGCLSDWKAAEGKTLQQVIQVEKNAGALVIFSDGSFMPISVSELQPASLIRLLLEAKPFLKQHHAKAFEQLEALIAEDKEMQRMARMENIMGAIENNLPQIPELKEALEHFIVELNSDNAST